MWMLDTSAIWFALYEEYMTDMQQMYPNICLGQIGVVLRACCVLVVVPMTSSRQTD